MEQSSEKDEETKTKPTEEEVSRETIVRGDTLDKFIDKDSRFRRTKQQIINETTPTYHITSNHLTLSLRRNQR